MSGILECDGAFEVPVPDGWSVTGIPGETYELTHAAQDVTVNISVYAAAPEEASAADLVARFAESTGVDPEAVQVLVTDDRSHSWAFARFSSQGRDWLAVVMKAHDTVVLASSDAGPGDAQAFSAGEQIVASLGPAQRGRKRRWFSRA